MHMRAQYIKIEYVGYGFVNCKLFLTIKLDTNFFLPRQSGHSTHVFETIKTINVVEFCELVI